MYKLNKEEQQEVIRVFEENGFVINDLEEVVFYLENNGATYLGDKDEVVSQWAELMGVDFPLEFLDEEYIVENSDDWEELSQSRYINIERLFEDGRSEAIRDLELKQEAISYK